MRFFDYFSKHFVKISLILYKNLFKMLKGKIKKCRIIFTNKSKINMEEELMQVTDVRIRKITNEGKMKAVVSVTFDNCFVVHDIKIIEGQNGLFIAMPSRKTPEGEFKDIAHPINQEMRDLVQRAVIEKYEAVVSAGE